MTTKIKWLTMASLHQAKIAEIEKLFAKPFTAKRGGVKIK